MAGAELAVFTYMDAERPFGFPDPNLTSGAAQRYRTEFMQVVGQQAAPPSEALRWL